MLLGLAFFVFGLNAFLQFLKGPIPGRLAGQFLQALFQSHYVLAVGAVQGSWDRVAAHQPLCSAGADNSWAGNRKHLLYHLLLNHEGIGRRIVVMNERLRIGHQPSKFS